jgi:hypothetical protein
MFSAVLGCLLLIQFCLAQVIDSWMVCVPVRKNGATTWQRQMLDLCAAVQAFQHARREIPALLSPLPRARTSCSFRFCATSNIASEVTNSHMKNLLQHSVA